MSSLLVRNLDDDIVAKFRLLAIQNGLSVEAFHRKTIIDIVQHGVMLQPRDLNEVLMSLPCFEGDEDLFQREQDDARHVVLGD